MQHEYEKNKEQCRSIIKVRRRVKKMLKVNHAEEAITLMLSQASYAVLEFERNSELK
jgi:hypothetical protein